MSQTIAIILGQSHIGALTHAVENRRLADHPVPPGPDGARLHLAFFEAWAFGGDPPFVTTDGNGADQFNPAILAGARRAASAGTPLYCAMFGGNAHFVLALMRHQRPFDLVLPEAPDLPLDPAAEILPLAYVEAILQRQMERYLYQLYRLRQALPEAAIVALAPPPPIADDAFVVARLDAYFRDNWARRELSPPALRLKMWLLQRRLLKRICDAQRVDLIDPPADARTPDGYLAPACYGQDATHGGPHYGELVLRQIEARAVAPLVSYATFGPIPGGA